MREIWRFDHLQLWGSCPGSTSPLSYDRWDGIQPTETLQDEQWKKMDGWMYGWMTGDSGRGNLQIFDVAVTTISMSFEEICNAMANAEPRSALQSKRARSQNKVRKQRPQTVDRLNLNTKQEQDAIQTSTINVFFLPKMLPDTKSCQQNGRHAPLFFKVKINIYYKRKQSSLLKTVQYVLTQHCIHLQ